VGWCNGNSVSDQSEVITAVISSSLTSAAVAWSLRCCSCSVFG